MVLGSQEIWAKGLSGLEGGNNRVLSGKSRNIIKTKGVMDLDELGSR